MATPTSRRRKKEPLQILCKTLRKTQLKHVLTCIFVAYLIQQSQLIAIGVPNTTSSNGIVRFGSTGTTLVSASACYRNRASAQAKFGSKVQFIFTAGLEGTGHHWIGEIANHSTSIRHLRDNEIWPKLAESVQASVFQQYSTNGGGVSGLVNAHCSVENTRPFKYWKSLGEYFMEIEANATTRASPDNVELPHTIPFPINTIRESRLFGMLSYPNFAGECRSLNYPDLNLLFSACNQAEVDCYLVYTHRHPVDILNSVSRRNYSTVDNGPIQMYTTLLNVLSSQIRNYASQTLGCFDFFSSNEDDTAVWQNAQLDLWDWKLKPKEYEQFLQENYKPPSKKAVHEEKYLLDWIKQHPESSVFMKNWWKAHKEAIETCRQATMGVMTQ
eukprot:Nitzschia sp. Nitz4//scaffold25_size161228//2355//3512//NITZ4_002408-RA/size161228-processed-gene-0.31-mRNA-1//1//CDS//3329544520//3136//frame0